MCVWARARVYVRARQMLVRIRKCVLWLVNFGCYLAQNYERMIALTELEWIDEVAVVAYFKMIF
jgi:hypothetical protein